MIAADTDWRQKIFEMEQLKKELNSLNKEIGQRKKVNSKDSCDDLVAKAAIVKECLPKAESGAEAAEMLRERLLRTIGNIVDSSVVADNNEDNNEVISLNIK